MNHVRMIGFRLMPTLIILGMCLALPVFGYLLRDRRRIYRHDLVNRYRAWPRWSWLLLVWLLLWWAVAWGLIPGTYALRPYSFTPLWLGFIALVNLWEYRRRGNCVALKAPLRFGLLFGVSAAFWWFFEYLNRFTENWVYVGAEEFSFTHYLVHGSICFSTVLPAVLSVFKLLCSFNRVQEITYKGPRLVFLLNRPIGGLLVFLGLSGAYLMGRLPQYAYPMVWLSPVLVGSGLYILRKWKGRFISILRGDTRWPSMWALSALVCGFFWEMWNQFSLLRWEYQVPVFGGLHIFEMPLLGYLGYLPFGIICGWLCLIMIPREAWLRHQPNG